VQCGLVILTFADSSDALQIGEFHVREYVA